MSLATISRLKGCILGGAIGDAIGLFTEFLPQAECIRLYGPSPRFSLLRPPPAGYAVMHMDRHRAVFDPSGWTDDTDQSLLIFMSWLRSGGTGIDEIDFAKRLKFWVCNGFTPLDRMPLGLGRTVGGVVREGRYEADPVRTAKENWERSGRNLAANGAVMRTPVIGALLYQDKDDKSGYLRTFETATAVASTTHADPRCLVSCTIASGIVAAIMRGQLQTMVDLSTVVSKAVAHLDRYDPPLEEIHKEELSRLIWAESLDDLQLDERSSIGYTYKCLASGTWALSKAILRSPSTREEKQTVFEQLITELTMAGGDADTNCAVAGSLLGAYLGVEALPAQWIDGLAHRQWLERKVEGAASLLGPNSGFLAYDWKSDDDTLVDGGKGAYTVDALDVRWKVLIEGMHIRLGDLPGPGATTGKAGKAGKNNKCIIC